MERCPVKCSAAALIADAIASEAELERLDAEVLAETEAAAKRAQQAPFPAAEQLFDNVW